jgi:hypothetical protein
LIANAKHGQQNQREKDLLAKFGNREDRPEFFPHKNVFARPGEFTKTRNTARDNNPSRALNSLRCSPDYQNCRDWAMRVSREKQHK